MWDVEGVAVGWAGHRRSRGTQTCRQRTSPESLRASQAPAAGHPRVSGPSQESLSSAPSTNTGDGVSLGWKRCCPDGPYERTHVASMGRTYLDGISAEERLLLGASPLTVEVFDVVHKLRLGVRHNGLHRSGPAHVAARRISPTSCCCHASERYHCIKLRQAPRRELPPLVRKGEGVDVLGASDRTGELRRGTTKKRSFPQTSQVNPHGDFLPTCTSSRALSDDLGTPHRPGRDEAAELGENRGPGTLRRSIGASRVSTQRGACCLRHQHANQRVPGEVAPPQAA